MPQPANVLLDSSMSLIHANHAELPTVRHVDQFQPARHANKLLYYLLIRKYVVALILHSIWLVDNVYVLLIQQTLITKLVFHAVFNIVSFVNQTVFVKIVWIPSLKLIILVCVILHLQSLIMFVDAQSIRLNLRDSVSNVKLMDVNFVRLLMSVVDVQIPIN